MDTLKNRIINFHVKAAQEWRTSTPGQKKATLLAIPLTILLFDAAAFFSFHAGYNILYWAEVGDHYTPASDMLHHPLTIGVLLLHVVVTLAQVVFINRYSKNINNASHDE